MLAAPGYARSRLPRLGLGTLAPVGRSRGCAPVLASGSPKDAAALRAGMSRQGRRRCEQTRAHLGRSVAWWRSLRGRPWARVG